MLTEHVLWGDVPQGFSKVTAQRGCWLVVRSDKIDRISAGVCIAGGDKETVEFEGRERLRSIRLGKGDTALIRTYRHGGLLRHCSRGVFCSWPPRPFRELAITEEIRRRGIPTVETYAACVKQVWGPFYRGWLVTRELIGAQDLWRAFQSGLAQELGIDRILHAVADSLRALHREGVYHTDLNLKNILISIEQDGVKGYIIDFDKAKLVSGALSPELVRRNLNRLLRSINKLDPERSHFSTACWDRFVNAYYGIA
jgi:3-deoxy-D-manno-octulosonic acid kinase